MNWKGWLIGIYVVLWALVALFTAAVVLQMNAKEPSEAGLTWLVWGLLFVALPAGVLAALMWIGALFSKKDRPSGTDQSTRLSVESHPAPPPGVVAEQAD